MVMGFEVSDSVGFVSANSALAAATVVAPGMRGATTMTTPDITRDRRAAALVAVPALLSIAAILHHPVAHVVNRASIDDVVVGVQQIAVPNAAFHAMILLIMSAQAVGIWSVAERLGFDRLAVRAGAFFYAVAVMLLFGAATMDGFATPLLGHGCAGDATQCAVVFAAWVSIERAWIQAFTTVGLATQALGLACWSLALIGARRAVHRATGVVGFGIAVAPIVLLATSDALISPHRLAMLMAFECAWSVGAAIWLWMRTLEAGRSLTDLESIDGSVSPGD
jgi:hypothetical protein